MNDQYNHLLSLNKKSHGEFQSYRGTVEKRIKFDLKEGPHVNTILAFCHVFALSIRVSENSLFYVQCACSFISIPPMAGSWVYKKITLIDTARR